MGEIKFTDLQEDTNSKLKSGFVTSRETQEEEMWIALFYKAC